MEKKQPLTTEEDRAAGRRLAAISDEEAARVVAIMKRVFDEAMLNEEQPSA